MFAYRISIAGFLCMICVQTIAADVVNIRLKSIENEPVSLIESTHNGKFTLVMIWATNCPPCEEQKPMIQQFHTDFHETKASVVGVVIDGQNDIDEVNRLLRTQKPSYPNYLADPKTFLDDFEFATGKIFSGAPTYIMLDDSGDALAVAFGPITREQLEGAIAQ